jgi:hypothetical protein
METKLREIGGNGRRLLPVKLNPNPLSDYFGHFPKARRLVIQQVQEFLRGESAIEKSPSEINPWQLRFLSARLCGPVLEP